MSNTILQAQDLVFGFAAHQIFKQFSVNIPAGITYVVGNESSGKSTLLRLFAGNLLPQAGSIAIGSLSQTNDLASYKKHIFCIDPRTSVYDQISPNDFFDLQRRFYPAFDDAILLDLIEGLSLSDHVSKAMYMLSAGSKRKVWLAAAFASGAAVTLLDEPFAALDKPSINFLIERLVTFAHDSDRAWVIADYEVPQNLVTNLSIDLDL
jgi:ABC-type multidrug transport system ATPase subunit